MTDLINRESFGNRLVEARRALGISQTELGRRIYPEEKSTAALQSKIKRFESGDQLPTREEVISLGKVLGVNWRYLVFENEDKGTVDMEWLKSEIEQLKRELSELRGYVHGRFDEISGHPWPRQRGKKD